MFKITKTDYWLSNFHFCYRELLKEIKKAGEIHIVLDCSTEKIQSILTHASQVGMMTAYHNYLITSLVRNNTFLTLRGIHLHHLFFIFPFIYISIYVVSSILALVPNAIELEWQLESRSLLHYSALSWLRIRSQLKFRFQ